MISKNIYNKINYQMHFKKENYAMTGVSTSHVLYLLHYTVLYLFHLIWRSQL